ncbi:MAG: CHAT domain-containing protein, partial [Leptolyngbyaceae bacterium]|nr:CHAT domain-containing protein [Leptolyngbyaceae bacterium]
YGGSTQTVALLPGSPAIDAGGSGAISSDQRGIAAVGTRDIGAFESRGFTVAITGGDTQSATVGTAFATPLSVRVSSSFSEPVQNGILTFTAPSSDASLLPAIQFATLDAAGNASLPVTANATAGSNYPVSVGANGITTPVTFSLTNNSEATSFPPQSPEPPPYDPPNDPPPDDGDPENRTTTEYTDHLGLNAADFPIKTLKDTQESLRQIEVLTGVKPALLYLNFASVGSLPNSELATFKSDEDPLELLIVSGNDLPIIKRVPGATRAKVIQLANTFRRRIMDPESRGYLASARQLYQLLVAPVEAELGNLGINNLVLIADAGLRSLPFAALHDGERFLVEKYSVGMMPSFSLTDTRYTSVKNFQVLAMGASQFQEQQPLPAVPEELSIINRLWQGKTLLNEKFTLSNLKAMRQQNPYPLIHLATHGEFQPGVLSNSYIQLWDSKLRLNQLRDLRLNNPLVELLVLSACTTALGNEQAELGFAGFAVQAGVKSALASLWYVSDAGTLGLMTEFYNQLKTTSTKAEALQKAQLAMIQGKVALENGQLRSSRGNTSLSTKLSPVPNNQLAHPYYWAAFTLIGNPW